MNSELVNDILKEFENVRQIVVESDEGLDSNIKEYYDLLNDWREEFQSAKPSVFVVGKTSTGKSEFHNFILDINNTKKEALFKTATSPETGVIQTLEHCSSKSDAYAQILLKDNSEFHKLNISKSVRYELNDKLLKIPLDNEEQVCFFRESLNSRVNVSNEKGEDYNFKNLTKQIDIKYPLKFFKDFKIIDTPGFASGIDSKDNTEANVRKNVNGKSYILWFFDASHRTLNDTLTLINDEKELLKENICRIRFIGNKFDILDAELKDGAIPIEEVKLEMTKALNDVLMSKLECHLDTPILFSSMKKWKKKYGDFNTIEQFEQLEEQLLMKQYDTTYKNIDSLMKALKNILSKHIEEILTLQNKENDERINQHNDSIKSLDSNLEKSNGHLNDTKHTIQREIDKIDKIKKQDKLNTHEKYNKFIDELKAVVVKSVSTISQAFNRIDYLDLPDAKAKLLAYNEFDDLSLKKKENLFKRYFHDKELDKKKIEIDEYVHVKKKNLTKLNESIVLLFEEYHKLIIKQKEEGIDSILMIEEKKRDVGKNSEKINQLKYKVNTINRLLLNNLETHISSWKPKSNNEHSTLQSFLQLYSLLEEHTVVTNKYCLNGEFQFKNNSRI